MIWKCAWLIWISYKCTIWSIFGLWLCLKFANTLFTCLCHELKNWCNLRVLSEKFLWQKSYYPESFRFFLTPMTIAIRKSLENTKTKKTTMTMTMTKTITQMKYLKHPLYAIFLKSWWLTHSKFDGRYITRVILFTSITMVTLVISSALQGRVYS